VSVVGEAAPRPSRVLRLKGAHEARSAKNRTARIGSFVVSDTVVVVRSLFAKFRKGGVNTNERQKCITARAHVLELLEPLARFEQAPCGHAAGELALAAVDQLLQQAPPRAVLLVEHRHRAGPCRLLGAVPVSKTRWHRLGPAAGSSEAAFSARAWLGLPQAGHSALAGPTGHAVDMGQYSRKAPHTSPS
jgi:hypothetical protein